MQSKHADREVKKPCVLTIAMLGTNEHRNTHKTLLTQLLDSIQTGPNQYKHLIDGLGGGSGGKTNPANKEGQVNPRLGSYKVESKLENDVLTVHKEPHGRNKIGKFIDRVKGLVYGKGHNEAIAEVLDVVQTLVQAGKKPIVLNLAGFSRGADTMLRAINELSLRYTPDEVRVNFFAIDPVPGAGRHKNATRAHFVPDIVNDMQVILMQDDHRSAFQPLSKADLTVEDPNKTQVSYHVFNGTHSSPNYFYDPSKDDPTQSSTQDPARLASAALTSFAIDHGIALERMVRTTGYLKYAQYGSEAVLTEGHLTPAKLLANYTRMALREQEYANITGGDFKRDFTKYRSDYMLHGVRQQDAQDMHQKGYFLDRNHMNLFRAQYPLVFDYCFQQNAEFGSSWSDLHSELQHISKDSDLSESLEQFFAADITQNEIPANGIPLVVSEFYDSRLSQLWEGIQSMVHQVPKGINAEKYQANANTLYQDAYAIITGPGSQEQKEAAIVTQLFASQENNSNAPLFNYRANQLLHQLGEQVDVSNQLANHLIAKLEASPFSKRLVLALEGAKETDETLSAHAIKQVVKTELRTASAEFDSPPFCNAESLH